MHYFGGKQRISKPLSKFLNSQLKENQTFVDLFCGSCNIISKIDNNRLRIANDKHKYLIAMWKALQKGWEMPNTITEEEYKYIKSNKDENLPLTGFVGFGCSYSGKWFGGYCRDNTNRNYCLNAKNSNLKILNNIRDVVFYNLNYDEVNIPLGSLVYCFDKDTEVLTKDGWKFFKDIDIKKDEFLSREPNTKKMEYVKAVYYISYKHDGKMYKYTGRQLDICVTDNHNIFGSRKKGRKGKEREEFLMKAIDFANLPNERTFIKAGGKWEGTPLDEITIADEYFDPILFARLLGIFLTDGSVNNQGLITILQSKENVINLLIKLLNELNMDYSIYKPSKKRNSYTFYLSRKYLPFFKQFYLKENRNIPYEFKNANVEIIESLIEGILDGDSDSERRKIILNSKSLLDDIQECLYKIGKSSNYRIVDPKDSYLESEDRIIHGKKPYYVISILNTEYPPQVKNNIQWIDYNDYVYCITLEKWHTVLTRRNGKTVWMGQCDIPYKNTTKYCKDEVGEFNHDNFYKWVRNNSNKYDIYISEYKQNIPDDFKIVWEYESKKDIRNKNNQQEKTTEVLIQYRN